VKFLEETLGGEITRRIISHFKVGTARSGGTVFWYFDKEGYCRMPKVVFYAADGHRIKDDPDRKPHCAGYTNAKGYSLPLFGEQQLNERLYSNHTPVVLVESEKTACVGYAFLPQYVWLASGGARSINKTRAAALNGRQVLILPDADQAGREGAQRTLHLLKQLGVAAQVKDLFLQKTDHTDLADHLLLGLQEDYDQTRPPSDRLLPLAHPMPQEETKSLEAVFSKHPLLWQLTEQLGLTITSVKRCYQYPSR
jgi:hypothetical protein